MTRTVHLLEYIWTTNMVTRLYDVFSGEQLKVAEKIQQRRLQMLVHSYIYYHLGSSIVSDEQWYEWAHELKQLQQDYPEVEKVVPYRDGFESWDASTGAFLPYHNAHIMSIAGRLLGKKDTQTDIKLPEKPKVSTKNVARKKLF